MADKYKAGVWGILVLCVVLPWNVTGQGQVHKCFGDLFSDTLCPAGTVIAVNNAEYGVSSCPNQGQCCPSYSRDCLIPVRDKNVVYFESIKDKCDGRRACQGLVADWTTATVECGAQTSDYVLITYTCDGDAITTPPNTGSETSSTSAAVTTETLPAIATTDNSTTGRGGDPELRSFSPIGLSVGLCVGLLMALIPLTIGLLILKKRRQAEEAEAEKQQPQAVEANQAYDDDDDVSWGEDWDDDDWEGEEPPPGGDIHRGRSSRKKSRKSRMSRKHNGDVPNEYTHTDDIYDVIDPSKVALEEDLQVRDAPRPSYLQNGHAGTWSSGHRGGDAGVPQDRAATLPPASTEPSKVMVNNDVYTGYSDSEQPPAAPVQASDDVYLEPVQGATPTSTSAPDQVYDHAVPYDNTLPPHPESPPYTPEQRRHKASGQYDGLEFTPGTTLGMSYEALDHSTLSNKRGPSVRRQGSNVSDIYWCVETPDDSTV